jgi:hypothetical protein
MRVHFAYLLLSLLVFGCSRPRLIDESEAMANLKSQAELVIRAVLEKDHAMMATLTHSALVEQLGGRDRFIQKLESIAAEIQGEGFRFKTAKLGEPTQPVESAGEYYVIFPYSFVMAGSDVEMIGKTFLICVSKDGGRTWKFLDGHSAAGDRDKLKTVLPHFPDQLQLPEPQQPSVVPKPR